MPVEDKEDDVLEKVLNIADYTSASTSADGTAFTSVLLPLDVDSPLLSGVSAAKYVKFDNDAPTVNSVTDTSTEGDWERITVNADGRRCF